MYRGLSTQIDQRRSPLGQATRLGRRRGVTLTEVVVGSALLVAAIVPALRALTIVHMTSTAVERKTQSLILAQSKLDEIRAKSIHHYSTSFRESSKSLADSYLCNVSDDEDPGLRFVTVAIGFDENADRRLANEEIAVTLATYVARRQ